MRCQGDEGVRCVGGLEDKDLSGQRGRCAARRTGAARRLGELRAAVRLVVVSVVRIARVRLVTGWRHSIRIGAVQMLRHARGMLVHPHRMRMQTRSAMVSGSATDHRCGSEALDGDRQGQEPHHHDP